MKRILTTLAIATTLAMAASSQVTLTVKPSERGPEIGKLHYGIFFEEINHAGDGGLYAELVRNGSFEDNANEPEGWTIDDEYTKMKLVSDIRLNNSQHQALLIENKNSVWYGDPMSGYPMCYTTISNSGYWGMNIEEGETYELTMWVRMKYEASSASFSVSLYDETEKRDIGHSKEVEISDQHNLEDLDYPIVWEKITVRIVATASCANASLKLHFRHDYEINVYIDCVSLMPVNTYKGHGCRKDLAEMLEAMKPAFMRFPGGCYIEGEWRNGSQNRFEWKKTIGPREERPGHWNVNWNYRVSDGFGFHEMLQLAEDLGAAPLFVVNIGLGHGWYQQYDDLDEYIQEALDALEYANGDVSTYWGAKRAENGHPEPFNLKLIEIGNENYNYSAYNNSDQSDHYAERYWQFYQAIKERYPDVMCIGNVQSWGTDSPTWRNEYPVDAVDEHYYRTPAWFVNAYDKYDNYDRTTSPKVYAGEYAVTSGFGSTGNLAAALGEAVYMQGMENNSDLCVMASYAPIFVNENDQKWMPDMIRFNASESYGTPSYYVQQLMPNYVDKENVKWTETGNNKTEDPGMAYRVGLSTWDTSAEFSNYTITLDDGTVYSAGFNGDSGWQEAQYGGQWSESGGTLTQGSTSMQGRLYINPTLDTGTNYTIELDATKTAGREGFLIAFNYQDPDNYIWWNLGGWGNSKHAVEVCSGGTKTTIAERSGYLYTNETYHLKIEVNGPSVKCYINNELTHSFSMPVDRRVYVSSSINDETGKLYLKITNPSSATVSTVVKLQGYSTSGGKLIRLSSASDTDENTNDDHYKVVPVEMPFNCAGSKFLANIPPYSLNIYELDITEGETAASNDGLVVDEGTFYLYNSASNRFLSRGADWGTRATLDSFGVPVEVKATGTAGEYTLRYIDMPKDYLGKDNDPYTDKQTYYPINWRFMLNDRSEMVLQNTDADEFLAMADGIGIFTTDITQATAFTFIGATQRDEIIAVADSLGTLTTDCDASDVTDLYVKNPNIGTSTAEWSTKMSKGVTFRAGVGEVYEGYGTISQTVTGLVPGNLYRVSIPAFYRSGSGSLMAATYEAGFPVCNAYVFAGDIKKLMKPWAADCTSDKKPNTMEEAADCFANGLYMNTVTARADANGELTIGLGVPQKNSSGWAIWGDVKLEHLTTPVDYTASIINPSFENGFDGWTSNMQTQSNNEPAAKKDGTLYCEMWTPAPGRLWDVYATQTIEGLPIGRYRLTAACHAENQSGTPKTANGAYLYAESSGIEARESVSKSADYSVFINVTDGSLTIGFKTEDTDANWVTVDNLRLTFVGGGSQDLSEYKAKLETETAKLEAKYDEKKGILPASLKTEVVKVIEAARAADTAEAIRQSLLDVKACYGKIYAYRTETLPLTSYIFAYFPSNSDENLYFAHSLNGFDFTPLNNGRRIMASDTVAIKKGIRDPHILRGEDGKTFYMVATDMRCAEGWASNRGIVMYKSTDLIHWQHSTVHFPTRFPNGWSSVTRVWAPEVIWDPDYSNTDGTKGRYMVYFSLLTSDDGTCNYDKVYYCYANDDFTDLLDYPVFLYDRGSATIDADIVYDDRDQLYHMIYKNEGSGGICHTTARTLTAQNGAKPGSQWGTPSGNIQQTTVPVEGGGLFRLINSDVWVVMYDCYTSGHYQFCTTDDWNNYTFKQNTYTSGAFTPRHGTVLPITTEEAKRLLEAFPTDGYAPELPEEQCLMGDVDGDGCVTMADANVLVNAFLGLGAVPSLEVADLDGDGRISMADANAVVNLFLGF